MVTQHSTFPTVHPFSLYACSSLFNIIVFSFNIHLDEQVYTQDPEHTVSKDFLISRGLLSNTRWALVLSRWVVHRFGVKTLILCLSTTIILSAVVLHCNFHTFSYAFIQAPQLIRRIVQLYPTRQFQSLNRRYSKSQSCAAKSSKSRSATSVEHSQPVSVPLSSPLFDLHHVRMSMTTLNSARPILSVNLGVISSRCDCVGFREVLARKNDFNELNWSLHKSGHKIPQLIPCEDETCAYRTTGDWKYAETKKIALVHHPGCICRIRDVHSADTEQGRPPAAAWENAHCTIKHGALVILITAFQMKSFASGLSGSVNPHYINLDTMSDEKWTSSIPRDLKSVKVYHRMNISLRRTPAIEKHSDKAFDHQYKVQTRKKSLTIPCETTVPTFFPNLFFGVHFASGSSQSTPSHVFAHVDHALPQWRRHFNQNSF